MHRYEREIDRVLAPYYRLGFIEYDASKAFVDKVLDYLSCTIPPLIKRFCTMEALELVNIVAVNAAELSFVQQMDAVKNKGNELYGYYEEVLYNDFNDPASLKWKLARLDTEIEHYESTRFDSSDWNYGYTYGIDLVMRIHLHGAVETRDFSHERSRTSPPFNKKQ